MFEVLPVNDSLHELIVSKASARDIRNQAIKEGMRTLQACGWEHVKSGKTKLSEVLKYVDVSSEG